MKKLNDDQLAAAIKQLFPNGIAAKVGNGKTRSDGKADSQVVTSDPSKWSRDVLLHTLGLGFARWHGQHLNGVPVDGGAKVKAMLDMIAQAESGDIPSHMQRKSRASGTTAATLTPLHGIAAKLFADMLLLKLHGATGIDPTQRADKAKGIDAGKTRIAEQVGTNVKLKAARPFVTHTSQGWAFLSAEKMWLALWKSAQAAPIGAPDRKRALECLKDARALLADNQANDNGADEFTL